ncbi:hypothetical protein ABZ917_47075 [Nonomuraea wenchangensis]
MFNLMVTCGSLKRWTGFRISVERGDFGRIDRQGQMTSVCEISENRERFSGQDLVTEGWITSVRQRRAILTRRPYVIAQLRDAERQCWVRIFDRGHDFFGIKPADAPLRVTVSARYFRKYFGFSHELHPYSVDRIP